MEYNTKQFAAVLNCSVRTVQDWRISRKGNPPKLLPVRYDEKKQAIYTDDQIPLALALNKRKNKNLAPEQENLFGGSSGDTDNSIDQTAALAADHAADDSAKPKSISVLNGGEDSDQSSQKIVSDATPKIASKDFMPMTSKANFGAISPLMKKLKRFLCWQLRPNSDKPEKPKKVPMTPKNGKLVFASVTDPRNWLTYNDALSWYKRGLCSGIGFALAGQDPRVCCVDVDHCFENGELTAQARAVMETCKNSWSEISQSGKGIHIWFIDNDFDRGRKKDPVEVYAADRYIALTGNHIQSTAPELLTIDGTCREVIAKFIDAAVDTPNLFDIPARTTAGKTVDVDGFKTNAPLTADDRKLVEYLCSDKCRSHDINAFNLFSGNTAEYFKSTGKAEDDSVADHVLMLKILYYVGDGDNDADIGYRALRIFDQSALAKRDKWSSREDYRLRTLNAAFKIWNQNGRECFKSRPTNDTAHSTDKLKAELREVATALADFDDQKNSALERLKNVEEFDSETVFSDNLVESAAFARLFDKKAFSDFKREVKTFGDKHTDRKVSINDWLAEVKDRAAELESRQADLLKRQTEIQAKINSRDFAAGNDILQGFSLPDGYSVSATGIVKIEGKKLIPVCRQPVVIKSKTYSVDDDVYKFNLAYKTSGGRWKTLPPQNASIVFNKNKLVDLADKGLPVTSTNAAHVVDFLDAFNALNESNFPLTYTVNRCGWCKPNGEEIFVDPRRECVTTIDDQTVSVVVDERNQFANALHKAGSLDEWKRAYDLAKGSPVARLSVAAAVAPPLLKVLNERNFLLYIYAPTRAGKSTVLNLDASAVGSGKLIRSFDATKNGLVGTAATICDFSFFVDEKQVADAKIKEQFSNLVYALANGVGRTKLNKDSTLRAVQDWRIIAIMNGETLLLPDNVTGGANTRLLTIAAPKEILSAETCRVIRNIIAENYGHAFPLVVDKIVEYGCQKLRVWYQEFVEAFTETYSDLLPEYCRYLAVLTLADCLLNSALGVDNALDDAARAMKAIVPLIPTTAEISDTPREKEFVIDFISQNQNRFVGGNAKSENLQGFYGKLDDPEFVFVAARPLQEHCALKGFDYRKLVADLIDADFFVPDTKIERGHKVPNFFVQKKLGKVNTRCYKIRKADFDRDETGITV